MARVFRQALGKVQRVAGGVEGRSVRASQRAGVHRWHLAYRFAWCNRAPWPSAARARASPCAYVRRWRALMC